MKTPKERRSGGQIAPDVEKCDDSMIHPMSCMLDRLRFPPPTSPNDSSVFGRHICLSRLGSVDRSSQKIDDIRSHVILNDI